MRSRKILLIGTALVVGLVAGIAHRSWDIVARAGNDVGAVQLQQRPASFPTAPITPAENDPDRTPSDYGWGPVRLTDW